MEMEVYHVGETRPNWKDDCFFRRDSCGHCYWKDRWPDKPKCHKTGPAHDSVAMDEDRAYIAEGVLEGLLKRDFKESEIEKGLELLVSVGALALKKLTKLRELRKGVG